ncbi:hypothetical protein EV138_3628 [Kribbella voronezhensis]|uniref:Imidazolonepropionase-like amidohydrolase n=1 Tax=Kribbella voronezhensis TaxID=2512212 RepID=A0A4R7TD92_9ACTN|nr:amidohydrolase [Kribbella voronezhensis]TDU90045.1 hypothetical protein EV138_3628 [Kribbella voronezhensis]
MTRWVFEGIGLPAGDAVHLEAGVGDAEVLPGRFALPGLVDSHCHLTVGMGERGLVPLGEGAARTMLDELGQAGVRAVRDVGGDRSITLKLAANPEDGKPLILAAGRFFAPEGSYFPGLYEPVSAEQLLAAVAAHVQTDLVSELIRVGIDSVEHGEVITADDLAVLGACGGAWTPTLSAYGPPDPNDTPERLERRRRREEHMATMLPLARQYGVRVLTGSDVFGTVASEIDQLVKYGLTVTEALEAATTSASEFLGLTGTEDVVTYDADPREHPEILGAPAAVVLRGSRIR